MRIQERLLPFAAVHDVRSKKEILSVNNEYPQNHTRHLYVHHFKSKLPSLKETNTGAMWMGSSANKVVCLYTDIFLIVLPNSILIPARNQYCPFYWLQHCQMCVKEQKWLEGDDLFGYRLTSQGCMGGQWAALLDIGTQSGAEGPGGVLPC